MRTIQNYPSFITIGEGMEVARQVYLTEIKQVLEGLAKDKSTAPGGWTIEFFLAFFDLVG